MFVRIYLQALGFLDIEDKIFDVAMFELSHALIYQVSMYKEVLYFFSVAIVEW